MERLLGSEDSTIDLIQHIGMKRVTKCPSPHANGGDTTYTELILLIYRSGLSS